MRGGSICPSNLLMSKGWPIYLTTGCPPRLLFKIWRCRSLKSRGESEAKKVGFGSKCSLCTHWYDPWFVSYTQLKAFFRLSSFPAFSVHKSNHSSFLLTHRSYPSTLWCLSWWLHVHSDSPSSYSVTFTCIITRYKSFPEFPLGLMMSGLVSTSWLLSPELRPMFVAPGASRLMSSTQTIPHPFLNDVPISPPQQVKSVAECCAESATRKAQCCAFILLPCHPQVVVRAVLSSWHGTTSGLWSFQRRQYMRWWHLGYLGCSRTSRVIGGAQSSLSIL